MEIYKVICPGTSEPTDMFITSYPAALHAAILLKSGYSIVLLVRSVVNMQDIYINPLDSRVFFKNK